MLHPQDAYRSRIYAVGELGAAGEVQLENSSGPTHPALWPQPFGPWTSLGLSNQIPTIRGMDADRLVGQFFGRATLWTNGGATRIELGTAGSTANAIAAEVQVGEQLDLIQGESRAVMWRGSASSMVNLNPPGAIRSFAYATDGTLQGGLADFFVPGFGSLRRPGLWNGTAQSWQPLNPGPDYYGVVHGMAPGQQVGEMYLPGVPNTHAIAWSGTAQSWIDLHPPGNTGYSVAYATTGRVQVGGWSVPTASFGHACLWYGSASTLLDLHQFLPPGLTSSVAQSVYERDGMIIVGGVATRNFNFGEAVVWVFVPSPSSAIVMLGLLAMPRRRRPA